MPRRRRRPVHRYALAAMAPSAIRALLGNATRGRAALGWWSVSGGELAVPVLLRLGLDPKGEVVCTALALGVDGPGTARITAAMTHLPLGRLVSAITLHMQQGYTTHRVGAATSVAFDAVDQLLAYWTASAPGVAVLRARPGRHGTSDERLREVVAVVRQAHRDDPARPTKLAAQRLNYSEGNVRHLLRLARKRLGASIPVTRARPKRSRKGKAA